MGTLFKRSDRGGRKGNWYAQYTGPDGKRVPPRCTGTRDKKVAQQILNHWESQSALRHQGVIDHAAERIGKQSQRPITEHRDEFQASMEAPGRSAKHIHETIKAVNDVIDQEGWTRITDITTEGCERLARKLRKAGSSNRTIQKRFVAIKSFTKWCFETGRLSNNPLAGLKKPSPELDRKLQRRMLLPDEWLWLRRTTLESKAKIQTLTAIDRVLIYEIALQTGLRASEIRELTIGKLYMAESPPFVLVPSRSTKNKKPARQYVGTELAEQLRKRTRKAGKGSAVFDWSKHLRTAEVITADLERARNAWIDEAKGKERETREQSDFLAQKNHEGEEFDFHALRHTCGAWLAMAGEHPQVIQSIMRHSTITLTMDTYGHLFPASESDAVARLADRYFNNG